MEVTLAKTAGFCFGVQRAVDMAEKACQEYGCIWALGDIIHNAHEVGRLENISAGRASHREGKLRLRALRRKLDDVHLVQLFLPRHRHVAGGYARLIARHEIF